jgi:hypothetical protein
MAVGLLRQEPGTVGALGTMTDPRVWDSDDDKRSGTSRSVHDGRSHRPDNKRERRFFWHAVSITLPVCCS